MSKKSKMLHIGIMVLAVALLVVGLVVNNAWSPLLFSLGLLAVVVVLRLTWVQQASWVSVIKYPDSPSNGVILCKLIVSLVVQLATIYYASKSGYPILGAIAFGLSAFGWMCEEPVIYNSDPAGNGMARGFGMIFNIVGSVILAIIFYLVQKFVHGKYTLVVSVAVIALYFMCKVFGGYYSRTVGRYAEHERREDEMWEEIRRKRNLNQDSVQNVDLQEDSEEVHVDEGVDVEDLDR